MRVCLCQESGSQATANNAYADLDENVFGTKITGLDTLSTHKHISPLIHSTIPIDDAVSTHAAIVGVQPEKEKRIRQLYERLDINNDGMIDVRDLSIALQKETPHIPSFLAPKILQQMSSHEDQSVCFIDFLDYVVSHEQRLTDIFHEISNGDGIITASDVKNYCSDLGVDLDEQKALSIVQKIDQNGSSACGIEDFTDFMLLYPYSNMRDMVDFWRYNLIVDTGDVTGVPKDFSENDFQSGIWWRQLVAGAVAGAVSRTCTAPFDRLKVYMQVNVDGEHKMKFMTIVRLLHAEGGLRSFWRGNGINVVKIAPESALKFSSYEFVSFLIYVKNKPLQIKRKIKKWKGDSELQTMERFFAGSAAGAISQTAIYPMEVMKTRLALRRTGQLDKGFIHFAYKMYRKEGLRSFYQGYVPNLLGIVPYAGLDLCVYETLRNCYTKHWMTSEKEPSVVVVLACGTCSSTVGQLFSYPLALVKTRLQAAHASETDSMVNIFKHILKTEGIPGLYHGIAPNFMKVIPAVSISYVVYEKCRSFLGLPKFN